MLRIGLLSSVVFNISKVTARLLGRVFSGLRDVHPGVCGKRSAQGITCSVALIETLHTEADLFASVAHETISDPTSCDPVQAASAE